MSDTTRDATARLLAEHPPEVSGNWYGCASCRVSLGNAASYAGHLAEQLIAEFLVIPRSDTEYGWRNGPSGQVCPRGERDWALLTAHKRGGEAVERPALPWSVIPVPEDGDGNG